MDEAAGDDIWDAYDLILARDILGVAGQGAAYAMARDWVRQHIGEPARIVSSILSVGAVFMVETPSHGRLVLKAWGKARDPAALAAQVRIQAAFAAAGRPAPAPRSGVLPFGAGCAMLMEERAGDVADVRTPGVTETLAAGLCDFVRFAASLPADPAVPRRDSAAPGALWPRPHNALFDFDATARGAEWIGAIAAPALEIMRRAAGPEIVAHGDWTAANIRMRDGAIAAIYDWDSVCRWPETLHVGASAANFCMQWDLPVPVTPKPARMARFIAAYEAARGERFSTAEMAEVAASATYARAYNARCEHSADPGGTRIHDDSPRRALRALGACTPGMLRPLGQ